MIHLHRDHFAVGGAAPTICIYKYYEDMNMYIYTEKIISSILLSPEKYDGKNPHKSQIERWATASHDGKLSGLYWQVFMATKNA